MKSISRSFRILGVVVAFFVTTTFCIAQSPAMFDTLDVFEVSTTPLGIEQKSSVQTSLSVEQSLEKNPSVQLVNRGGYAPDISFRSLSSFQNQITIDGMRVFGACTDKMDPITSYVEITNLKSLETSGNHCGGQGINTIQLNLSNAQINPNKKHPEVLILSGYQTNGKRLNSGIQVNGSRKQFGYKVNASLRDASNYLAGGKSEINYTQYHKKNILGSLNWNKDAHTIVATGIYDLATDIGYATLPMDVSKAEAFLVKLDHDYFKNNWKLNQSIYWNQIFHQMDDSKRPDVAIRMDMPGWSSTMGINGTVSRLLNKWKIGLDYEGYNNFRAAEMTMFPENEVEMFMYTWSPMNRRQLNITPNIKLYQGDWNVSYSGTYTFNSDLFQTVDGPKQLNVFGYNLEQESTRQQVSQNLKIGYESAKDFKLSFRTGIGGRIPSLSELYGFYLFNSQDGFDYIGNPNMTQEKFSVAEFKFSKLWKHFTVKGGAYTYQFRDYIFGFQNPLFGVMTIGGNGVKVYGQVEDAQLIGAESVINYRKSNYEISLSGTYQYGSSEQLGALPLVSPLNFTNDNKIDINNYTVVLQQKLALPQERFNAEFGENQTPAFYLFDLLVERSFKWGSQKVKTKIGCTNIFDSRYTTHTDWNDLLRPGRSWVIEFEWKLNEGK